MIAQIGFMDNVVLLGCSVHAESFVSSKYLYSIDLFACNQYVGAASQ